MQGKCDNACYHHRTIIAPLDKTKAKKLYSYCLSNVLGDVVSMATFTTMILLVTIIARVAQYDLHLCITIAICYCVFHCYPCRGRPHEKCPLCQTIANQNSRELYVRQILQILCRITCSCYHWCSFYVVSIPLCQSINQHHKNAKIPSPGGRSVYTNKTDSVLSLSVQEYTFTSKQCVIIL